MLAGGTGDVDPQKANLNNTVAAKVVGGTRANNDKALVVGSITRTVGLAGST